MSENINLTKIFIRFLKEEGLLNEFKEKAAEKILFYDGVIDNLFCYSKLTTVDELFSNYILSDIISKIYKGSILKLLSFKIRWQKYIHENNYNSIKYIKVNSNYFNIATPIIIDFLIENNALKEVTKILHMKRRIKNKEIQNNDIDKLLRQNQTTINTFLQNEDTFCKWSEYSNYQPNHINWCNLSSKLQNELKDINALIIP